MKGYKKYFLKAIRKGYPNDSANLLSEISATFETLGKDTRFGRTSSNPVDRRMDMAGYFLALIIVLDHKGESMEKIRQLCHEIAIDYVRPKNKIQVFLKRLPAKLVKSTVGQILIKYFNKRVSKRGHPDGFVVNVITDKAETYGFGYGFDILECGICKLFEKHNYKRFASILCEVDNITSGLAGLKLIRSGTIANGAKKCDFRFTPDSVGSSKPF